MEPIKRVLIFGKGYVARKFREFINALPDKDRPQLIMTGEDIADQKGVDAVLKEFTPDVVINCAGRTGRPNIDWCEDASFDPAQGQTWLDSNRGKTWISNVIGPQVLAQKCIEHGVFLAHIGSGCVYEGDNQGKGFAENDAPNFRGSFYSCTKIVSEQALDLLTKDSSDNLTAPTVLQLRLRMPLDGRPGPRNFINKITAYEQVISIPNSISVMDDFIKACWSLIGLRAKGIYNVVNPGAVTHGQILDAYKRIVDSNFSYKVISLDELHSFTAAKRSNCVLSSDKTQRKLKEANFQMRPAMEAVEDALKTYKDLLPKYREWMKQAKGGPDVEF